MGGAQSSAEKAYPGISQAVRAKEVAPQTSVKLRYGTAGFRCEASLLSSTLHRMGMLASLRSLKLGLATGIMVTASHNAERDNGVKIVDPDGGMLEQSWETYAELLVNASPDKLLEAIVRIHKEEDIPAPTGENNTTPRVLIGRDTRPSSPLLAELALAGARILGADASDLGVLTTPQLHHCVRMINGEQGSGQCWGDEEWIGEDGYYEKLAAGLVDLLGTEADAATSSRRGWFGLGKDVTPLVVDGACGVGAEKIAPMVAKITSSEVLFKCEVRNGVGEGALNEGCGAEFVQKGRIPPANFSPEGLKEVRCCSFDGDADRIVYHYYDKMGGWHLLDGDKIAVLLASFLREEVNAALPVLDGFEPSFAAIQTAYANGASTKHLRAAGVPVEMTATGVKHLHHAAAKYDLGVYFEANGHGTVLFSDAIVLKLRSYVQTRLAGTGGKPLGALGQTNSKRESTAARRLLAFHKLSNQGVGDALSDMLLVESVLRLRGWSVKDWNGMYTDLPSRQAKLSVKDRTTIVCTNDETRVISPASLQAALDAAVSKYGQGRCFVRPSGTEDAVRVYAEAESQESADALALDALVAIHTHASGVGELPTTALQS